MQMLMYRSIYMYIQTKKTQISSGKAHSNTVSNQNCGIHHCQINAAMNFEKYYCPPRLLLQSISLHTLVTLNLCDI